MRWVSPLAADGEARGARPHLASVTPRLRPPAAPVAGPDRSRSACITGLYGVAAAWVPASASFPAEAMSEAAVLPVWLVVALAVGTPVLTFLGIVLANLVTRRGASELETRSRREETMRTLKWAAELAVANDPAKADLGLRELQALGDSALLDPEQQTFIDAALASVYGAAEAEIEAAEMDGEDVEVIVSGASSSGEGTVSATGTPRPASGVVSSESDEGRQG